MTSRQLNCEYPWKKQNKKKETLFLTIHQFHKVVCSCSELIKRKGHRSLLGCGLQVSVGVERRVTVLKSVWLSVYSAKRSWSGAMFVSRVNPFGSDADGSQRDLDGRVISLLKMRYARRWRRRRNPRDVWGGSSTGKRILYIQESLPFARICISTHIYSSRMMQYSWRGNIGRPFRTRYNEHRRSLKDSLRMCTPNTVNGYICIYIYSTSYYICTKSIGSYQNPVNRKL